jgi:murein L,D-transpeptidase YafK
VAASLSGHTVSRLDAGRKTQEGDGVTPVGHYLLGRATTSAKFHRFIAVSYPNSVDRACLPTVVRRG